MKYAHIVTVAIIEGILVMSIELGFTHLITGLYGSSIDVWTVNILSTMLGLAAGYFASAWVPTSTQKITSFVLIASFVCVYIAALTMLAPKILMWSTQFPYMTGLLMASFVFIFSTVAVISMLLPILIEKLSSAPDQFATHTSNVYFYSTLGSVWLSLLLGFILFESLGVRASVLYISIACGWGLCILYILAERIQPTVIVAVLLLGMAPFLYQHRKFPNEVYRSEGLLGDLIVQDFSYGIGATDARRMFLNNSIQTMIYKNNGFSFGHYPYLMRSLVQKIQKKSSGEVLLIGLGGGTIAYEFEQLGYKTTGVELDPRISRAAKDYFYPNMQTDLVVADGRFVLNNAGDQLYDYVVLDVFNSENPPYYLLTKEAFGKIKEILRPEGHLLINFNGFWNGKNGLPGKAIMKTLLEVGFTAQAYPTSGEEDKRNMIYVAGANVIPQPITYLNNYSSTPIAFIPEDLLYAPVLNDDQPLLPIINRKAAQIWRQYGIDFLKQEKLLTY